MYYKKKSDYLKVVAIIQTIGALLGLVGLLLLIDDFQFNHSIFIVLILFTFYSSYLMWIKDKFGLLAAKFNFILQVLDFSFPSLIDFKYNLLMYFNLGYDSRSFEILTLFGIKTQFLFNAAELDYFSFSINIFALGILYMLFTPENKWPEEDPFQLDKWD